MEDKLIEEGKEKEMEEIAGNILYQIVVAKAIFTQGIIFKKDLINRLEGYTHTGEEIVEAMICTNYLLEIEHKRELNVQNKKVLDASERFISYIKKNRKNGFDNIYREARRLDRQGRFLSSYKRILSQHTSIEHAIAIERLKAICDSEGIEYRDLHDETILQAVAEDFNYKKKRVEADLLIKHNKQWIIVEVERGTTTQTNMNMKMDKILSATNNLKNVIDGCKTSKIVLICSPNLKSLDKTKRKIESWEEKFNQEVGRGDRYGTIDIKTEYVSISAIKDKAGKRLKSIIKKAYSENKNKKRGL